MGQKISRTKRSEASWIISPGGKDKLAMANKTHQSTPPNEHNHLTTF